MSSSSMGWSYGRVCCSRGVRCWRTWARPVFSYKLRYIAGFGWSRWPSRPIRSLRNIVTCTRMRPQGRSQHIQQYADQWNDRNFGKLIQCWFDAGPALTLGALKYYCINRGEERVFSIVINVLVTFFRYIWIPMLWVYGQYNLFKSFSAGITLDVIIWRPLTSDYDV